ncbi:sensor domain-containing diguanylate cyclase [Bacillus sp. B190/17]|uniref:Sensor domain-containing diguanylate cyclase n=1 Tax=Bacillus lumedeiriae TaxID=3058829 RepID=A0ABW8I8V7_9BACI
MDEQLNYAPCGYLSLNDDGTILSINKTLLNLLGYDHYMLRGQHISKILTVPGRSFYQLYFFPMIQLHNKVEEMYLTLKSKTNHDIPVLVNASRKEREGTIVNDCVFIPMRQRYEYEQALLAAKKAAEETNRIKKKAIADMERLQNDLESKQKEMEELNAKLLLLATTDELTGLKNRRSFQDSLTANINLAAKSSQPLSLLLLDLDHFKKINDTFGHLTGDKVLEELAQILKSQCRDGDIAARYGGEEFAFIFPNMNQSESLAAAERIRSSVEHARWTITPITVSIGIATMTPGDTESTLQSKADRALYSSKHHGRNRVTHFTFL